MKEDKKPIINTCGDCGEKFDIRGSHNCTKGPPDTNYELLDKIKKQSMEIARLNAINASYSLDRRELAEHLAESGREHFKLGNFQLAMKIKAVVERVMK